MRGPCGLIKVAHCGGGLIGPASWAGGAVRAWRHGAFQRPGAAGASRSAARRRPAPPPTEYGLLRPNSVNSDPAIDRPQHPRQAADRLRDAHDLALLIRPGAARNEAVERWLHRAHAERQRAQRDDQQRQLARERQHNKPERDQPRARPASAAPRRSARSAARSGRPASAPTRARHKRTQSRSAAGPSRIARSPTRQRSSPCRKRRE